MAIPLLGAAIGAGAATIADYALGRPMNLWGRSIDAQQTPGVRVDSYIANFNQPNILPAPDAIIEAFRRGYLSERVTADALRSQGISWRGRDEMPEGMSRTAFNWYVDVWEQVGKMRRSRPDPATLARMHVLGQISNAEYMAYREGYDADWDVYDRLMYRQNSVPGLTDAQTLFRLGRITPSQYDTIARRLGWFDADMRAVQESVNPMPGLYTLMRDYFLGFITQEDYQKWTWALGFSDAEARRRSESAYYQIPSGPELVQMAVRDAWNEDVVTRWGYDSEFPEPLRHWMRAQGWDWGASFTGRDGTNYPSRTWPQLFWRAHWAVISPGQAYQAYRRLRPERIERFRAQIPEITPFTHDDLLTVLRVHDYPPAARGWLAALQSQPLRMMTIRTAYTSGARDRDWALAQLADIGYLPDDALAILDTLDAQLQPLNEAWRRREEQRLAVASYREVIAAYQEGIFELQEAVDAIRALGIEERTARRALALADSAQLRADIREGIRAIRRDYLAGAASDQEVIAALRKYRVSATAAARYLARWQSLRSIERRTATTAQILAWVREGLMAPDVALVRLANLGWVGGDALLSVQAAVGQLEHHQALIAVAAGRQLAQNAKQLQSQLKAAQAAVKSAQDQLRRITPLATVKKWYLDRIVSEAWVVARLEGMGYDDPDIRRYLAEWAIEQSKPAGGKKTGTAAQAAPATVPTTVPVTTPPQAGP